MKKNIKYLICSVFFWSTIFSQQSKIIVSDKNYENYNYVSAVKVYENLYDKGHKSSDIVKKIANLYFFQAEYERAIRWYEELISSEQGVESENYYRYAQSLKALKNYDKANQMMNKFELKNRDEIKNKLALSQIDFLNLIKNSSARYELEDSGISSNLSEYGGSINKGKFVFTSNRNKILTGMNTDKRKDQPFLDLYQADIDEKGVLSNVKFFSEALNSKYHESSAIITKDGKTIYFTRNNLKKGKKTTSSKKATLLKLYKATFNGKKWTNIIELPFNSDEFSVAHPALSPDEKILYFASDMPGTFGSSDIFSVEIKGKNDFGTPMNLGEDINTKGRESFPFISDNNELYFSSDGYPGLGGLDIYVAKLDNKGKYFNPLNVGEPVNSLKDDFSFLIDNKTNLGYVSSNRNKGKGNDDIYKFKEIKKISELCYQSLKGIVHDDYTSKALSFAKVILLDSDFKEIKNTKTDKEGYYDFGNVDCSTKYNIKIEKDGYQTVEKGVFVNENEGITTIDFNTSPVYQKLKIGQDIGKTMDIKPIYFDYKESTIREDAEVELNKILSLLEMYPKLGILIKSHTDSRASSYSNQILSEQRARATLEWLVSHGINRNRLRAIGFGETQLVNKCYNENDCLEDAHQANRRSEFLIQSL